MKKNLEIRGFVDIRGKDRLRGGLPGAMLRVATDSLVQEF